MATEEETSWDKTVEEWLIQEGHCCAGGLASAADGAIYAAAPVADEVGWGLIFKEAHEEDVTQEDGVSTKKVTIDEATGLYHVVTTCKTPEGGLWIGGLKYTISQTDKAFESADCTFITIFANRPKKGVHIICTGSGEDLTGKQIAVGLYDEEKGQSSGNCKKAVLAFAEYLAGIGY